MGNLHHPLELQGHAEREEQLKLSAKEAAVSHCQGRMKSRGPSACSAHGSILESNTVRCCQEGGRSLWGGGPVVSQEYHALP